MDPATSIAPVARRSRTPVPVVVTSTPAGMEMVVKLWTPGASCTLVVGLNGPSAPVLKRTVQRPSTHAPAANVDEGHAIAQPASVVEESGTTGPSTVASYGPASTAPLEPPDDEEPLPDEPPLEEEAPPEDEPPPDEEELPLDELPPPEEDELPLEELPPEDDPPPDEPPEDVPDEEFPEPLELPPEDEEEEDEDDEDELAPLLPDEELDTPLLDPPEVASSPPPSVLSVTNVAPPHAIPATANPRLNLNAYRERTVMVRLPAK
jgi:hypothetical protein